MNMTFERGEGVSIDRALTAGLQAISADPVTFAVLGLLFAGLPRFVMALAFAPTAVRTLTLPLALFQIAVSIAISAASQASVTVATVAALSGDRADLGTCLQALGRRLGPLLGVGVASFLGVSIGFVCLIVPGVCLALIWSLAISVQVIEGGGVINALRRSAVLTRGCRWRIFGLFLILTGVLIVALLFEWVLASIAVLIMAGAGLEGALDVVKALLSAAFTAVLGVFTAACVSAVYVMVRQDKEAASLGGLAAVLA